MALRLILGGIAFLLLTTLYTLSNDPSVPQTKRNVDVTGAFALISIITNTYGCMIVARSRWGAESSVLPACAPIGVAGAAVTVGIMHSKDTSGFGVQEWEYVKGAPARIVDAAGELKRELEDGCGGRVGDCVVDKLKGKAQSWRAALGL